MPALTAAALALALALGRAGEGAPDAADPVAGPAPEDADGAPALARRYVVERIAFAGLERTRSSELRKHLLLKEGDLLDEEAVLLSRLRLGQLGWFSRVDAHVERGRARGLVVLVFTVRERNTLLVSDLFVGSTDPQPLYGGLGLVEHNFLGRGLGLQGAFVYGGSSDVPLAPSRLSLRGAFSAPSLVVRGVRVHAAASLLFVRGEEITCSDPDCDAFASRFAGAPRLRYSRRGGALEAGTRTSPFARVLVGVRAERVTATQDRGAADLLDAGGGPLPPLRLGRSTLTALTLGWVRDTRDDPFLPRAGTRLDAGVTAGLEALGGDYEYSRYLVQGEWALSPWRDHGLRLQAALGAVQGDAPFFDRFYAADWAYESFGPALGRALELNFSTDSRYDRLLGMGGAEWAVPLWSRSGRLFHRGYLALGARAVWSAADAEAGRTRASRSPLSAEAALRFDTPVGRFNLSLGYALDNFL
jgi:outer membrane protein assembly factor BamA